MIRVAGRGPVLRVFLVSFALFAYFMPRWADWNIDSRLALVHALVDQHTVRIDRYHWISWDKAYFKGHYYSDKAPGTAVLGAAVYAGFELVKRVPGPAQAISGLERNSAWQVAIDLGRTPTHPVPAPGGTTPGGCKHPGTIATSQWIPWGNRLVPPVRDWALSKYVVTVGTVGFPSALFAAFFFWFLGVFGLAVALRLLLSGLYAFSSVALPYSTLFYSHQLAAAALFTAFALIFLDHRRDFRAFRAPLAGFLLGLALFLEYTVAVVVAVLALYAVWVYRRRLGAIAAAAAAGAVPVAAVLVYNYLCFGNALDTGYSHDFCWSAAQAGGFQGFTSPQLQPLLDLTFGPFRGLFYLSPFLLLAIPGTYFMARRELTLEAVLCLGLAVGFILLISAYWGWNGGKVEGPRYLVPIVPFLALPAVFYLERAGRSWSTWIVVAGTAGWSLFAVWAEFLGGYLFPISWWRDPIFQYSLPALAANQIAPNAGYFFGLSGWQSLVPLAVLLVVLSLPWPPLRRPTAATEPSDRRAARPAPAADAP